MLLFSGAKRKKKQQKKDYKGFRAGSTGLEREEKGGGVVERQGAEERSCKAKVITEADQLQSITQDR